MARKASRTLKKQARTKKPGKKKVGTKKLAKKQVRKLESVEKTVRAAVKSARQTTTAAKKAGKGIIRRAVEAVAKVAAPLLPGSRDEKPKGD